MAMERAPGDAGAGGGVIGGLSSRALLPAVGVVWRSCLFQVSDADHLTLEGPQGPLTLELPDDLRHAVAKRRSEYLAGRACAALALRALHAPETVGRHGRAPVWPDGIAGSITHTDSRVIAVAARHLAGIGVDAEPLMTAQTVAEVGHLLLSPDDHAARPDGMDPARFCTLVFSAKEATYKALSRHLTDIPEFHEARVAAVTPDTLTIAFRGWRIPVLHRLDNGDYVTLAILPKGEIAQ